MKSKRAATDKEVLDALHKHVTRYNCNNPNNVQPLTYWLTKLVEAQIEGYRNEVCGCGSVFLAFHHFTVCQKEECPFRTKRNSA